MNFTRALVRRPSRRTVEPLIEALEVELRLLHAPLEPPEAQEPVAAHNPPGRRQAREEAAPLEGEPQTGPAEERPWYLLRSFIHGG